MNNQLFILLTGKIDKRHIVSGSKASLPALMTLGFKQKFDMVFSHFSQDPFDNALFSFLDKEVRLTRVSYLISTNLFCNDDHHDIFYIFEISSELDALSLIDCLDSQKPPMSEKQRADLFLKSLPLDLNYKFKNTIRYEFPIFRILKRDISERLFDYAHFLWPYYCYGWLILQRIDRMQVTSPLTNIDKIAETKSILTQRAFLINIQRYFLGTNRSNDKEVKDFCILLSDLFRLERNYSQINEIHQSFERYSENASNLNELENGRVIKAICTIYIIISVPLNFLGLFVEVDFSSDLMKNPFALFSHKEVLTLLSVASIMPLLLIFSILGIYMIFKKVRQNRWI